MAFVYRAEREIKLSPEKKTDLGPGQYIVLDKGPLPENKAPFLSRSPKHKTVKDEGLGPGQYYRDERMIQIQKFMLLKRL